MPSKPEGWKQDNRRHYEAKVYGKASPGKNAMKPKYPRKRKKNPLDRSLSYVRSVLSKRRKGAIGYFYQDQFISLEEGDAIAKKLVEGTNKAWKDYRGHINLSLPAIKDEDYGTIRDINNTEEFPFPVKINPIQYRAIDVVNGEKPDWAMTRESAEDLKINLTKYIGKEVVLTGGGGWGSETGMLESVWIEEALFKKPENEGKKVVQVKLKNLEGVNSFGGKVEKHEQTPYLGSYRLSITEDMKMTKYKPPKKEN
jgi:hypothetical protein